MRSPEEVLRSHLALAKEGKVEEDLARNYAEDVLILTARRGVHRGPEGARALADLLAREMPEASFEYGSVVVEGEVGLLTWSGRGRNGARVDDGVDSFVIRDGRIVAQTISYTVRR